MIEEEEKRLVRLRKSIASCIECIVRARLDKEVLEESRAIFRMEGIMAAAVDDLWFIRIALKTPHQETSKDEDSIPSDVKEQATEEAILTACSEFKRFCDTMIDCSANSDKSVPEVFKHKECWVESFERELRNKLQAHQPMQG